MACAHHQPPPGLWARWRYFALHLLLRLRRWVPFLPDPSPFLLPPPVTTKNMKTAPTLAGPGMQQAPTVVKGPDGIERSIETSFMAPPEDVAYHKKYMRAALDMAEKALSKCNEVPVGCVFVHNNEIIGRGMNDTNRSLCGTRHAEFIAIEHILLTYPPSIFPHTDLYVTVEPCVMCASALRQLRIRRVFFGCMNERFGGTGGVLKVNEDLAVVDEPPYKVYGGINHDEAIMLLRRFYIQENDKAPQPIAKKSRKLKLEVAPFAGENRLAGVGEGTGVSPVEGATESMAKGPDDKEENDEGEATVKTEEEVVVIHEEEKKTEVEEVAVAHEEEKKIEVEEVKEILEDDAKHAHGETEEEIKTSSATA